MMSIPAVITQNPLDDDPTGYQTPLPPTKNKCDYDDDPIGYQTSLPTRKKLGYNGLKC